MTRTILVDGIPLPVTEEQNAILDAVSATTDNLSVVALAGAAKTTTLQAVAEELPGKSILCLAFNKNIATEMQKRLPKNCEAKTLNALGHRAFTGYLPGWPRVNSAKNYRILADMDVPKGSFRTLMQALRMSKQLGYTPNRQAKPLVTFDEMLELLPVELTSDEAALLRKATIVANKQLFQTKPVMDFDEQILGAACFPVQFKPYDVVLVDEAQDLSPINHQMLHKITSSGGRLIMVGDPLQAIYAFRGAHEHSMDELARAFSTTEYRLTTSFRCAKRIVEEARWLATDMQAAPWAQEGVVETLAPWGLDHVKSADAVLSRLNAPLFLLNIALFSRGINSEFVGHDIVKQLQATLKTLGGYNAPRNELLSAIDRWESQELRRSRQPATIRDNALCLRVVANVAEDKAGVDANLRRLLKSEGRIKLMTIHKSKGLEFDTVFLLNPDDIGDTGQELNLRYVAQTRAKQRLTYISLKEFIDG